jgi:hypothetical protein
MSRRVQSRYTMNKPQSAKADALRSKSRATRYKVCHKADCYILEHLNRPCRMNWSPKRDFVCVALDFDRRASAGDACHLSTDAHRLATHAVPYFPSRRATMYSPYAWCLRYPTTTGQTFPYFSACANSRAPSRRARPSPPACITLLWFHTKNGRAMGASRLSSGFFISTSHR